MKVEIEGGKYIYIMTEKVTQILRYGEPWKDATGDKFTYCMAAEIEALRARVAELELSRLDKECLRIGREIQRAAGELPDCYNIEIYVERGAGTVSLVDPNGECKNIEFDEGLSYAISDAIDAAIEQQKEGV